MTTDLNFPNLEVTCFCNSNLKLLVNSIRQCYDSFDKSDSRDSSLEGYLLGEKDKELIDTLVFKKKHHSVLEHLVFSFNIQGISRLCLQELARHRIASFSVKSSRYTLKELKNADIDKDYLNYIVSSGNEEIDKLNIQRLKEIQNMLGSSKLDTIKYLLPECYRTSLRFTINARSLRNFFELRLSKNAHFEIRYLARRMLSEINKQFLDTIFKDFRCLKLPMKTSTNNVTFLNTTIEKVDLNEGLEDFK